MNPEVVSRQATPRGGRRTRWRCITCGRWYAGPGECRSKKCHLPVQEWIPKPRRKPTDTSAPTDYLNVMRDGKLRRVVTQK